MGYAVELYFDPKGERRIRGVWEKLARRGISSLKLTIRARPHLSLAVFKGSFDPKGFKSALQKFARAASPISINFAAIGTFPTIDGVVFVQPVVTSDLLEFHRRFHAMLTDTGAVSSEYYRPGRWVPHCTVAQGLARAEVTRAIEACAAARPLGSARCVEIGVCEFRPVRERYQFPLAGKQAPRARRRS